MSNLLLRSITGFLFALVIIGSVLLGSFIQSIVFGVFLVLGLREISILFKGKENSISIFSTTLSGTLIYIFLILSQKGIIKSELVFSVVIALFFMTILIELWRKQVSPIISVSLYTLSIAYLVIPFYLMNLLCTININSFSVLLGLILLIWTNDTFAYIIGSNFGKTPLFERISPKKTKEGTFGGITMTILTGSLISYFTQIDDTLFWLMASFICGICGVFGDLLESLFKRGLNIKDSGNILPGHGGILDRFDAILFTVPFYYLWTQIYNLL
jgi:phosphatidate cytidylyltransferase